MINNTFYFININLKNKIKTNYNIKNSFDGDWGLGIGDWGLGIGPNPQSPCFGPTPTLNIHLND